MFGYSMVQMVRAHAHKLDHPLRGKILNLYKPFKWTPCFLHKFFEGNLKRSKSLSVIFEFEKDCYETGVQEVNDIIGRHIKNKIRHHFPRILCSSADVTPNGLEEALSNCNHIKKVYLNSEVHAFLNTAVPSANAKGIKKNGTELTGKGIKIAIIDTGIYPHPDLTKNNRQIEFVDFIGNKTKAYDDNGHGTHCAGDAASASDTYAGPAPNANLVGVKVLNKLGSGSLETVMRGVEWCISYNDNPSNTDKIDIISMSLGSSPQYKTEDADPMVQIVEAAWAKGIVVCVAAGNEGPGKGTIASPGVSDKVITVGALDDGDSYPDYTDDEIASFSSRGPTKYNVDKPDIVAPGVNITSLRSPNSYLDKLQKSSRVGSDYFTLSGTSMATPITAGVCALIKESKPALTPDEIKYWLKNGPTLWNDKEKFDKEIYGAGYINARSSIDSIPH